MALICPLLVVFELYFVALYSNVVALLLIFFFFKVFEILLHMYAEFV